MFSEHFEIFFDPLGLLVQRFDAYLNRGHQFHDFLDDLFGSLGIWKSRTSFHE